MTADRQDDEEGPETEFVIVLSKDTDGIWSCEVEFSNYVSTGGGGVRHGGRRVGLCQEGGRETPGLTASRRRPTDYESVQGSVADLRE